MGWIGLNLGKGSFEAFFSVQRRETARAMYLVRLKLNRLL